MTTYTCPNGHQSADPEWCDTCGAPIGGSPEAAPAPVERAAAPASPSPSSPSPSSPSPSSPTSGSMIDCPNCGLVERFWQPLLRAVRLRLHHGSGTAQTRNCRATGGTSVDARLEREMGRGRRGRSGLVWVEGLPGRSTLSAVVVVDRRAHSAHCIDRPVEPIARHPSGGCTGRRHRCVASARPIGARWRRPLGDRLVVDQRYISSASRHRSRRGHGGGRSRRTDATERRRPHLCRRMEPSHRPSGLSGPSRRRRITDSVRWL